MRRAVLLVALITLAAPAAARADATRDDGPALERVKAALAATRKDVAQARIQAEAVRADTARIVSASEERRTANLTRLDGARATRRSLAAREATLRSEIERMTAEVEALEADVLPARDAIRRLAASLDPQVVPPAEREERKALRTDLTRRGDDPQADLGPLATDLLAVLAKDARTAGVPVLATETVSVEGRGGVSGRVLRAGPGAWFLGSDGTEAIRRRTSEGEVFVACPGVGVRAAIEAFSRGETALTLPIDATGRALAGPTGSLVARAATLVQEGGIVMIPLTLLSATSVFVLVERFLARKATIARARALLERVRAALAAGDLALAGSLAREDGPVGRALLRGLGSPASPAENAAAAQAAGSALLTELRRRLWLLGTVASTSPFVGLFGTVIGIVRAFQDIARTGNAGFASVAAGISEALVATAAGIVVALIAVLAYNALLAASAAAAEDLRARAEEALDRGL